MEKKKHLLALNHNLFFSDGGVTKPRILFQNVTRKTSRPDYPLGDLKKIKIKKNLKKKPNLKTSCNNTFTKELQILALQTNFEFGHRDE